MNELIQISPQMVGENLIETVNARELHNFLEAGKDFSNWIKGRIEQYGFVENLDYAKTGELENKGFQKIEYHISLDMAKELAMVERNEKGKQARKYFIECERLVKQPMTVSTHIKAVEAYLAELKAHEETKITLTHEKELAKLENGKSVYGASINQVKLKTNKTYNWYPLQRWCDENDIIPDKACLNGYNSISVATYPYQAWLDIYHIDLNKLFHN